MNKRKFTLKTKILTGVGAGVIVAGAAAGASIAIYRASTSKDNDHIGDTDKADSLKQYKHDVLNKLAKKIYYLGYEKGLSDTQIKNNIVKQAGTLLNNVNKNVASLNQTQDLTDGEYSAIKQEAKKLGVDIFDNTASANSMNDSVSTYTNYLTQQDFSDSDIKTKTASFKNIWNNNLSASKDGLYDSFEFQKEFIMAAADQGLLNDKTTNTTVASEHFGIGKKLTSSKLKYTSFSNENGNGATTTLAAQMLSELGLSYIKSKSNEVLTVSVTPGFASNIIGYADTAQYEVGDEIESEDLSGLFTFSYDQVQGAILSDDSVNLSDIGVNVDELQPIEDSTEYDSSDSTMFAVNKNFTEYDGYGGTYRLAEFMPGFKLHTRIVSKDVDSKSQICHLELELGVSVLTSGGAYSEILWDSVANNWAANDSDDNTSKTIPIDIKTTQDEVKYISQNRYYATAGDGPTPSTPNKDRFVTIQNSATVYDANNDTYYGGDSLTATTRIDLLSVLSKISKNSKHEYVIDDNNPLYLDVTDLNDSIDKPKGLGTPDANGNFHGTQKLKLKLTDLNDGTSGNHNFALKGHWVMSDTSNTGETFDAQTFGWSTDGSTKTSDDIWISFYIDPQIGETIKNATNLVLAFNQFVYVDATLQIYDDKEDDLNSFYDAKANTWAVMTLNATVLGVQLAVDIISKIMSFGTMSTLSCILDAAALGLMIFAALYQRQVIDNLKKNLNAWDKANTAYSYSDHSGNTVHDVYAQIGGAIHVQYLNLLDPKLDIQLKISSANTVMGVIKNIGDDFASLMTEIMQDFASIFAKDMTASEATDYSNLLKKLGEGDDQATSALLYSMATVAVLGFKVLHGFGVEIWKDFIVKYPLKDATSIEPPIDPQTSFIEPGDTFGEAISETDSAIDSSVSELGNAAATTTEVEPVIAATLEADAAAGVMAVQTGNGKLGGAAVSLIFTAIEAVLATAATVLAAISSDMQFPDVDPSALYAIKLNDDTPVFTKNSVTGNTMQFDVVTAVQKDNSASPPMPTDVTWGIDNTGDQFVGSNFSIKATDGKAGMLTLMVIPSGDLPKEGIELVISAMFKINNVQKELRTIVNVFVS